MYEYVVATLQAILGSYDNSQIQETASHKVDRAWGTNTQAKLAGDEAPAAGDAQPVTAGLQPAIPSRMAMNNCYHQRKRGMMVFSITIYNKV